MWEDLLQNTDIKQLNKTLQKIDSLLSLSGNQFGIQNFYLAFYGQKKNTYLAAFNLNDINTSDAFTSFLKHYFKAQKTGSNRYQCLYMDDSFYVYVNMGFVLFSGDSDLLEKSITRKKGTLAQNKLFMQAYEGIDTESDLNVFVHLPHFYTLAWKELLTTVPPGKTNSQENWVSADALISPNEIKAQGFMSDDSSVFYQLIKQQKTVSIKDAFSLLPYSTTQAQVISMLNYPLFIAAAQSNQIPSRKAQLSNYSDLLNADAELEIEKFIGDFSVLFNARNGIREYQSGLIHVNESKIAADFLKAVCDSSFMTSDSTKIYVRKSPKLFTDLCEKIVMSICMI